MPGVKRKERAGSLKDPKGFLRCLRSDPGFKELEDLRAMCARYIDEDGLSSKEEDDDIEETDLLPEDLGHDHFKDQEMLDRATGWARDYEGVMAYLQGTDKSKKKAPWPKSVPRFEDPAQMIAHFKDRWEKLKCRYC